MYSAEIPRTFVLTVPRCMDRYYNEAKHLNSVGIQCEPFMGIDNEVMRLTPMDTFDIDRVGDRIGQKQIVACLSHYLMWKVMLYCPGDCFWALEWDAEFKPDWKNHYAAAMAVLPDDWDMVYLGSCCCSGRPTRFIGNNLAEVKWPLCGHAIMYRKKALVTLLDIHQKIWAPLDIGMRISSLPRLRVYTILPRMVNQRATPLPP